MALTRQQREDVITDLVDNCDCGWSENDRELLATFEDSKLTDLHDAAARQQQTEAVANAAVAGFTVNELNHEFRLDPQSNQWQMRQITANMGGKKKKWVVDDANLHRMDDMMDPSDEDEEEEDEETPKKKKPTMNRREPQQPPTLTQMLASATPEERAVWNSAMRVYEEKRTSLADELKSLAERTTSEKKRQRINNMLSGKPSVEAMQELLDIASESEPERNGSLYHGNAPAANSRISDFDKNNVLPLPDIDYSEWAQVGRKQA